MNLFKLNILILAAMLAVCFSSAHAGYEELSQVDTWTGNFRISAQATGNNRQMLGTDLLKESLSVSAQVIFDKKKATRRRVTWEGSATCTVSTSFYGKSSLPESGIWEKEEGSDSRIFTVPARLVFDKKKNKYIINKLCKQSYSFTTERSGVGVTEQGALVPFSDHGEHRVRFGNFHGFDIAVSGPMPEQGNHLMGSYDLTVGPENDPSGRSMNRFQKNIVGMSGMEVSGKVQWSLMPDLCQDSTKYSVSINFPAETRNYVFREKKLSEIGDSIQKILFKAVASNGQYENIYWNSLPEIPDTKRKEKFSASPAENENIAELQFDGIPAKNDGFGEYEIAATLEGAERCTEQGKRGFRVFFERDGDDGPSADQPNWFYYWLQTAAAQGHEKHIRYDDACDQREDGDGLLGWFNGFKNSEVINICDIARISSRNDDWGVKGEGIDAFAVTVMHEWQHKIDYHRWWGEFDAKYRPSGTYQQRSPEWVEYANKMIEADEDADMVPKWVDADDQDSDIDNDGYNDNEPSGYIASKQWKLGSVDEEDWACPGKQCK